MNPHEGCRVLLTGTTGFVGGAVLKALIDKPRATIRAALRLQASGLPSKVDIVQVGEFSSNTSWQAALAGIDTVIHAAGRVHIMNDDSVDSLAEFRKVNVDGTLNFARQAASAGVKRFIFISSIKVYGEGTSLNRPYTVDTTPAPVDAYGISKYEAEEGLLKLAKDTGMGVVIIRPPLIYGAGVKANFLSMMRWLDKGVPLPLGAIHNKRSLVALDNLVDLIVTCIEHPAAANQIFLAGDGEDLSTTELLRRMAAALGRPARLLPVPQKLLESGLKMLGKGDLAQRLCGSLQMDISKARMLLGWEPPLSVDEGLRKTAEYYLAHQKNM